MDFAISKIEVPGFKQLWEGYIFKAAKICVQQLRALKEIIYKGDREGGIVSGRTGHMASDPLVRLMTPLPRRGRHGLP